eukprot:354473-Chlamydomonas_euryale.AAC.6
MGGCRHGRAHAFAAACLVPFSTHADGARDARDARGCMRQQCANERDVCSHASTETMSKVAHA